MRYNIIRRLLTPAALALCLSLCGCGPTVLDFRNAEMNNGTLFARGSNTPFTGKVTNVPNTIIFNDPDFKAIRDAVVSAYRQAVVMSETQPNIEQIAGATVMLLRSTGLDLPSDEDNAVVFCTINVDSGRLAGKVSCSAAGSDDVVLETAVGKNATFDGLLNSYVHDDGKQYPLVSATLSNGKLMGMLTIYSARTHTVVASLMYANGLANGAADVFDENTGGKLEDATYVDGKLDGNVTDWAPGGKVIIGKGHISHGVFDGAQEIFDPATGNKTAEAHWANGKLNGVQRHWDAQGNLTAATNYQDGIPVQSDSASTDSASNQPGQVPSTGNQSGAQTDTAQATTSQQPAENDSDRCVDAWIFAYRKEKGDDAIVSNDQVTEWESSCKQGKYPG